MGYGDFQTFLPSESLYKEPGMALVSAKAEGAKRASYLSSMDQFYAELGEKSKQFDLAYGIEEKKFGLEEKEFGLEEEKFDWEREKFERAEGLEYWKEGELSRRHEYQVSVEADIAHRKISQERELFLRESEQKQATGDFFRQVYGQTSQRDSYQPSISKEVQEQKAWDDYYNTVMAW